MFYDARNRGLKNKNFVVVLVGLGYTVMKFIL